MGRVRSSCALGIRGGHVVWAACSVALQCDVGICGVRVRLLSLCHGDFCGGASFLACLVSLCRGGWWAACRVGGVGRRCVVSCLVMSCEIMSCHFLLLARVVDKSHVSFVRLLASRLRSCPVASCSLMSCHVMLCRVISCRCHKSLTRVISTSP